MRGHTFCHSLHGRIAAFALAFSGFQLPLPGAAPAAASADIRRDVTVQAVERVLPSVVNIRTEMLVQSRDPFDELFSQWFGPFHRRQRPDTPYSLGSGVIVDESGYILTNLHVVRRASRIHVVLSDGRTYEAERYYATAISDIALLKLKTNPGDQFKAVTFAREDDVLLGETVLALGNPFGLGGSVSRGILSSKSRTAPREHEELDIPNWLQTDASINPGNSGGPLVNMRGELIGMNVAVLKEAQGIGFAIPVKLVLEALSEIFSPETVSGRWFGARVNPREVPLQITWVQPGSPAEKAGLRIDDRILQVNGRTPGNFTAFVERIGETSGKSVQLQIQRGGERRRISIELVSFPDLIRQKLGADLQELTPELARSFGLAPKSGLVVAEVERGSPADRAELRPGYVITGVQTDRISELLHVGTVLSKAKGGDDLRLTLLVPQRRGAMIVGYRQASTVAKIR
jgi:serine protease Do